MRAESNDSSKGDQLFDCFSLGARGSDGEEQIVCITE